MTLRSPRSPFLLRYPEIVAEWDLSHFPPSGSDRARRLPRQHNREGRGLYPLLLVGAEARTRAQRSWLARAEWRCKSPGCWLDGVSPFAESARKQAWAGEESPRDSAEFPLVRQGVQITGGTGWGGLPAYFDEGNCLLCRSEESTRWQLCKTGHWATLEHFIHSFSSRERWAVMFSLHWFPACCYTKLWYARQLS